MAASASVIGSAPEEGTLASLDPSLADDFRPIFDREVPVERRMQTDESSVEEIGTLEALRIKVLLQGDPSAPSAVRVELSR